MSMNSADGSVETPEQVTQDAGEAVQLPVDVPVDEGAPPTSEDDVADAEPAPSLAELVAAMARVESRLGEYDRLLTRHADVASRLHSENQELRKGELRQAQTSLVLGVVRVIDDVNQMCETAEGADRSDLLLVAESLVDTLEGYGVERTRVSDGDRFDGKAHRIAEVTPTGDQGLDRTIASVVRPGFAWLDGTQIRVASVVVYKFVPVEAPAGASDPQEIPENPLAPDSPRMPD
jgi:molecular chaperone GrpE (heat shock protein)